MESRRKTPLFILFIPFFVSCPAHVPNDNDSLPTPAPEESPVIISVSGINIDKVDLELTINSIERIIAVIEPIDATNQGVAWRSSDPRVATVTESGIVKAVSLGTAGISVTSLDGGYYAVCDVRVRDREWGNPSILEMGGLYDDSFPCLSAYGTGNAIVGWNQNQSTTKVYAKGFNFIQNRKDEKILMSDESFNQNIAGNIDGDMAFIWAGAIGPEAVNFTPDSGWGDKASLQAERKGSVLSTYIACNNVGNAIAVRCQRDGGLGTKTSVRANIYTKGSGWTDAVLLENDDAEDTSDVKCAMDNFGNAIVVWEQIGGSGGIDLWMNQFETGKGWDNATQIGTSRGQSNLCPEIALDTDGNAIVVWNSFDESTGNRTIKAKRFEKKAGWANTIPIETESGNAIHTKIAYDRVGDAIAVWEKENGGTCHIRANRFEKETGWGNAVILDSATGGRSALPQIACDQDGNMMAVWEHERAIWANRFDTVTGWGVASPIFDDSDYDSREPKISFDAVGNAVMVWSAMPLSGSEYNLWMNSYQ